MQSRLGASLFFVIAMLAMLAFWQWLSRQGSLDAVTLIEAVRAWTDGVPYWLLAASLVPVYLILLHLMFPLTVLVVLTGLLFGPWEGFVYASLGTLLFAATSFWLGHWLGKPVLFRLGGRRMIVLSRYLSRRGISVVFIVSLLPIAPFGLTNMLAGASHIRFTDYMLGSTLGLLPGIAAVTLLGDQLGDVLLGGGLQELPDLLLIAVIIVLAGLFLRLLARRFYRA
jgi:uncharacterized membrane protein YdjX (TVP38/TMEM64 family)